MNPRMPIKPFEHPLWEGSKTLTDDDAIALLYKISVDPAARDAMITGYTRLALSIAGQYLTVLKSRRWVDEVVSAALLGVIEGVDALAVTPASDKVNPRHFVAHRIHWTISAMLKQENLQCKQLTYVGGADWFDSVQSQSERAAEVESALDQLAENDTEQTILNLRKLGYSDQEVADQLGLHRQSVQVIRQDLHRRFCDLLPGGKSDENEATKTPEGVNQFGAGANGPIQKRSDT